MPQVLSDLEELGAGRDHRGSSHQHGTPRGRPPVLLRAARGPLSASADTASLSLWVELELAAGMLRFLVI